MKITSFNSYPNPGSIGVRLHSLDVGFSLLAEKMTVVIPEGTTVASFESPKGDRLVVEGDREDIVRTLRGVGYVVL